MEILGLIFTACWGTRIYSSETPSLTTTLFSVYLVEYLFLRLCASKRIYRGTPLFEGIGLHFKKAMIPTSYILAIVSSVGLATQATFLLWGAVFLLGLLACVNLILLYLHAKDNNVTPVNTFSKNKEAKITDWQ